MEVILAIALIAGCGLFLSGCSQQEKKNTDSSLGWEPIPEENLEGTMGMSDDGPANNFMQLKCTSANEEIVRLKNTSGNSVQGGTEAINVDTEMEKFKICNTVFDKICCPEIEDGKWKCTNKTHISNGCDTVDCTSFLFCTYGFGIIYIYD